MDLRIVGRHVGRFVRSTAATKSRLAPARSMAVAAEWRSKCALLREGSECPHVEERTGQHQRPRPRSRKGGRRIHGRKTRSVSTGTCIHHVLDQAIPGVLRQWQTNFHASLTANTHYAGMPIEIIEPHGRDVAGAKAESR